MRLHCIVLTIFILSSISHAQEATEEIPAHRVQAWIASYTDEDGTALTDPDTGEAIGIDTAFLEYEGGLIAVWPGNDFVFSEDEDGILTGTFLLTDPDIVASSVLTIIDEDTRSEVRTLRLFGTEQTNYITYSRSADEIEIWTESARNFLEDSMLSTCMGRPSVTLSFGYTAPDLLMPFRFNDDGSVLMDGRLYVGGEHEDVSTREFAGTSTTTVTIRSLDTGGSSIGFGMESTTDGRDDCQLIYESSFSPFDSDFIALLANAETIGAEED